MKPTLLVLAAGMGSRYGGLKQLDEIGPNGEAIIDYSIYDAIQAGFGKIVFVIRESFADLFKEKFNSKYSDKIQLEYVMQELDKLPKGVELNKDREKPWGTGHAVLVAAEKIQEPFAVINADDFYGAESFKQLASFLSNIKNESEYCMVGFELGKTLSDFGYVSRGVCNTNENDFLIDVTERTQIERKDSKIVFTDENNNENPLQEKDTVSMNMWGFAPSFFKYSNEMFKEFITKNNNELKAEFYIPTVVNNLLNDNKITLKVLRSSDQWFGVTYKEDKEYVMGEVKKLTQSGLYPNDLSK